MPNPSNCSFNCYNFLIVYLVGYLLYVRRACKAMFEMRSKYKTQLLGKRQQTHQCLYSDDEDLYLENKLSSASLCKSSNYWSPGSASGKLSEDFESTDAFTDLSTMKVTPSPLYHQPVFGNNVPDYETIPFSQMGSPRSSSNTVGQTADPVSAPPDVPKVSLSTIHSASEGSPQLSSKTTSSDPQSVPINQVQFDTPFSTTSSTVPSFQELSLNAVQSASVPLTESPRNQFPSNTTFSDNNSFPVIETDTIQMSHSALATTHSSESPQAQIPSQSTFLESQAVPLSDAEISKASKTTIESGSERGTLHSSGSPHTQIPSHTDFQDSQTVPLSEREIIQSQATISSGSGKSTIPLATHATVSEKGSALTTGTSQFNSTATVSASDSSPSHQTESQKQSLSTIPSGSENVSVRSSDNAAPNAAPSNSNSQHSSPGRKRSNSEQDSSGPSQSPQKVSTDSISRIKKLCPVEILMRNQSIQSVVLMVDENNATDLSPNTSFTTENVTDTIPTLQVPPSTQPNPLQVPYSPKKSVYFDTRGASILGETGFAEYTASKEERETEPKVENRYNLRSSSNIIDDFPQGVRRSTRIRIRSGSASRTGTNKTTRRKSRSRSRSRSYTRNGKLRSRSRTRRKPKTKKKSTSRSNSSKSRNVRTRSSERLRKKLKAIMAKSAIPSKTSRPKSRSESPRRLRSRLKSIMEKSALPKRRSLSAGKMRSRLKSTTKKSAVPRRRSTSLEKMRSKLKSIMEKSALPSVAILTHKVNSSSPSHQPEEEAAEVKGEPSKPEISKTLNIPELQSERMPSIYLDARGMSLLAQSPKVKLECTSEDDETATEPSPSRQPDTESPRSEDSRIMSPAKRKLPFKPPGRLKHKRRRGPKRKQPVPTTRRRTRSLPRLWFRSGPGEEWEPWNVEVEWYSDSELSSDSRSPEKIKRTVYATDEVTDSADSPQEGDDTSSRPTRSIRKRMIQLVEETTESDSDSNN